jgi:hypothetical protein
MVLPLQPRAALSINNEPAVTCHSTHRHTSSGQRRQFEANIPKIASIAHIVLRVGAAAIARVHLTPSAPHPDSQPTPD